MMDTAYFWMEPKNNFMTTTLWILQGILAFVFIMIGVMKLIQPKEKVVANGGGWAEGFAPNHIKLIGAFELLCGIGVIVPKALGHGFYSTATAATGIVIIMAGAMFTHFKRKEYMFMLLNLVFLLMALYVGYYWCPALQH